MAEKYHPLDRDQNGDKGGSLPKTTPIRLLRDTWTDEGRIVADGKVAQWPTKEARRLIDAGVAERADPLPGE